MARKISMESLEKKIENKKGTIAQLSIALKAHKEELAEMENQLMEMKKEQVVDIITKSGKSIEEIINLLGITE